jgi:transposase-like protein
MRKKGGTFPGASFAEKKRQIRAFQADGLTRDAFCQREGISRSTLYRWHRQVTGASLPAVDRGKRVVSPGPKHPPFAEVRVQPEATVPAAESSTPSPYRVSILLSSGDRLFLPEACNPRWLGQVVRALRSGRC